MTAETSLKDRLNADLREALRSGDDARKRALRMALAAIHNTEIARGGPLDDAGVLEVLRREVKQRRDSIAEFEKGERADLVEREQAEIAVLQQYLPQSLSREEIQRLAEEVIRETGAQGPRDKGKVMRPLLERVAGRADGREVNEIVSALLEGG